MYKYKIKLPMAAIMFNPDGDNTDFNVTLNVGLIADLKSTPTDHASTRVHFCIDGVKYMCAPQVWGDCVDRYVEAKVEVPVESHEESEFFQALQGSLEEAVEIKLSNRNSAANEDEFDTFEEKMKHSVADAVARLYEVNDRYVRDFHIRIFSDGSMQILESDQADAEIVMEFGDEQGFVVGDVHGNIQKWVDMIMDVGFVDHVINHKTSFAARYNLR